MPTFRRDDLTLHYTEHGDPDCRPVVLMHGLTLSSRSMERLAEALTDRRVVLLDLHGHGKSSRPRDSNRYSMSEFAADVAALLQGLLREDLPPTDPDTLRKLDMPTLVIGHWGDPLHVLADVREVAEGLPNSRLLVVHTFWDFRVRPGRLAEAIATSLDELEECHVVSAG